MRTVSESKEELRQIDKTIKEKEVFMDDLKEDIIRLEGIKSGITWTLQNKKGEVPNALLRPKP